MPKRTTCRLCGSPDLPPALAAKSDYRCRACHNAHRRAKRRPGSAVPYEKRRQHAAASWRRAYADPAGRQKIMARMTLRKAISRGHVQRQPCEVCGFQPAEGHHDDYAKPLDVRWLCRPHHRAHHQAEREAARIAA